jgi:hypothetical protein
MHQAFYFGYCFLGVEHRLHLFADTIFDYLRKLITFAAIILKKEQIIRNIYNDK